jgi:hemoglobin
MLALLTLCLVIDGVGVTAARADDPADADKRVAKGALDAVRLGPDLYNRGNHEGCYRLYQGAVIALLPQLDHRPKLAALVKDRLEKSKAMRPTEGAFALREALDAVLAEAGGLKRPLWDRLGGEKAVRAVVKDFLAAAAPDPKVNFTRDGKYKLDAKGVADLEQKLVELVSATTGGPLKYTGRDMKTVHAGMKITDAEFDALAGHLVATLKKYNVPQAEIDDLLAVVGATRKDIVEVGGKKVLWDRLGGEEGVRAVVREFLASAAKDPKANIDRNGNYPLTKERAERVEKLLIEQISSVTGGPLKYTGRDMKNAHAGMKITEDEFAAAAGHLVAALKKLNVPQAEADELLAIIATTKNDIVGK